MSVDPKLEARLKLAVAAWSTDGINANNFWQNWRGTGTGLDDKPCVALVQYAKAVNCVADDTLNKSLDSLLKTSGDVAEHYVDNNTEPKNQCTNLMLGIIKTVDAALHQNEPSKLAEAARHFQKAWKLTQVTVPPRTGASPFSKRQSTKLLQVAHGKNVFNKLVVAKGKSGITTSTWLILETLLAELFGEQPIESTYSQDLNILFFRNANNGHVEMLNVQAFETDVRGVIPHPLAFGPTLLDLRMQQSLKLAYQCCRQDFPVDANNVAAATAIVITPHLGHSITTIRGDSAGGLFAVGMLATAKKKKLDSRRTATVALKSELFKNAQGKDIIDWDDSAPLDPDQVYLDRVGGFSAKIGEASEFKYKLNLIAGHEEDVKEWKRLHAEIDQPVIEPVSTLPKLLETLKGDAKWEEPLEKTAHWTTEKWERIKTAEAGTQNALENDEHRLDCFVHPHLKYEIKKSEPVGKAETREEFYRYYPVTGEDDEPLFHLLQQIVNERKRLVVYDKAGAGKTVFSLRMEHLASSAKAQKELFGNNAPLVVRWHGGWPEQHGQRLSIQEALEQYVLTCYPKDTDDPAAFVRYALQEERVVIILDGFDQFDAADLQHVETMHKVDNAHNDLHVGHCRWIITSRVHTIEESSLFDQRWLRVRIDPFNSDQQDKYFSDLPRWREVIPSDKRDDFADYLEVPVVLRMIRRLIENTRQSAVEQKVDPETIELPRIESLGDLHVKVARLLLKRAIEKSSIELAAAQLKVNLEKSDQLEMLDRVLCLLAFQMMIDENYNGIVEGGGIDMNSPLAAFEKECLKRFLYKIEAMLKSDQIEDYDRDDLTSLRSKQIKHFYWALNVLKTIELNHRAATETYSHQRIAFRSRKVVECYAARYLTSYATTWDLVGDDDSDSEIRSAWMFAGDPQWDNCWQLTMEMPVENGNEAKRQAALAIPFRTMRTRPVLQEDESVERICDPRPTTLMFRIWHKLKNEESPILDDILAGYRQQFLDILNGTDLQQARLAAELLLDSDIEGKLRAASSSAGRWEQWKLWWRKYRLKPKHRAYSLCSDATKPDRWRNEASEEIRQREYSNDRDWLRFMMGAAPHDPEEGIYGDPHAGDNEKPWEFVKIPSFYMATTCVTVGQYRLFDPQREKVESMVKTPTDDCPMIQVDWYDAFCFALWLGDAYQLPSDCQWEGAAWGGIDRDEHKNYVIGVDPYTDKFKPKAVNVNRKQTDPVREFQPNGFGLFQMNGNVLEWCRSLWNSVLEEAIENKELKTELIDVSHSRSLRGGSWDYDANGYHLNHWQRNRPNGRSSSIGFRLSRTRSPS